MSEGAPSKSLWGRVGRIVFLILGLGLAAFLLHGVGFVRVGEILNQAKGSMPFVIALEATTIVTDTFAVRAFLGPAADRVSISSWVRSSTLAYGSGVLLPAGRAMGEAMRATALAPMVGAPRATAGASRLQASTLYANAAISIVIALEQVISPDGNRPLAIALAANALVCATLATVVVALIRSKRFAAWLGKRFANFVSEHRTLEDPDTRSVSHIAGFGWSFLGRLIQAVQYGIAVRAVGGGASLHLAISAQGIHLVGAAIGDFIPNQIGVAEGAYRAFTHALGFDADPARALAIPLVVRIAQIGLAIACLAVTTIVARKKTERAAGA